MGKSSGENLMVKTLSEEHKRKLSEAHKGKATWNKGLTSKTDSRVKSGMQGKHHNEETKMKLSQLKKGKPSGSKGWKMSDEQKEILKTKMPRGKKHHCWKGGRILKGGYVYVYSKYHPNKTKEGYVLEHRLSMEKKLGRYLTSIEVVHHIDGNKLNNEFSNLMLFENTHQHTAFEKTQNGRQS